MSSPSPCIPRDPHRTMLVIATDSPIIFLTLDEMTFDVVGAGHLGN